MISFQYSGFQQTSEKCGQCGHLIMEMVRKEIVNTDTQWYDLRLHFVDLDLDVPLQNRFCLGGCKSGNIGLASGKHDRRK